MRVFRLFSLLALFSLLVLYGVFRSTRFQELMRRNSERVLQRMIGRAVSIGGFDLALVPPSFVVRDVSIANDPRGLTGSCFSASEVELRGVPRISGDRIDLPKVRLVGPRIVFEIFADGTTNFSTILAALPKSKGAGVDIRLREAVLQRGTIRFRDWDSRIDAVLKDAALTARSGVFSQVTRVALGCRHAQFRLEENQVLDFQLGVEATLSPGRVHLGTVRLRSESLSIDASGGIDDLKRPVVSLAASALTTGEALHDLFGLGIPLKGGVATSGTVRITPGEGFRIRGRFSIPNATFGPFPMSGSGFIRVDPDGMVAHLSKGEYAGGTVEAMVRLERLKSPPLPVRLLVKGRDVGFESFLADLDLPGTGLLAKADVDATLTFGKGGIERADGTGVFTLRPVTDRPSAVPGRHALPVAGGGPLLIRDGTIDFGKLPLQTAGGAHVTLEGTLTLGTWIPDWTIDAQANDLAEIERLADNFYPAIRKQKLSPPLLLGGSGRITGHLTRSFEDPRVTGRLAAQGFVLRGVPFGEASAEFTVDRSVLTLAPFTASDAGGGLTASGDIGWGNGLGDHYRLEGFAADFGAWPIERVLRFLDIDLPLTGLVTGRLPLDGVTPALTGLVPLVWEKATLWEQNAERLDGTLSFEGDHLRISGMTASIGGGRLTGGGTYRYADRAYDLALDASALPVAGLRLVAGSAPGLSGSVTGTLRGHGTVDRPGFELSTDLATPAWEGKPLAKSDTPLHVTASVSKGSWNAVLDAPGAARLTAAPEGEGSGAATRLRLDVKSLEPYGPLLGLPEDAHPSGTLSAEAVSGAVPEGAPVSARGVLAGGDVTLFGKRISLAAPASFRVADGRVVIERLSLKGVETGPADAPGRSSGELTLNGSVGLEAPHPLDVGAAGAFDAAFLKVALPGAEVSGRVALNIRVSGDADKPLFAGRLNLEGVDYLAAGSAAGFESITGSLLLVPGRITSEGLSLKYGGGNVDVGGSLGLDGTRLDGIRLNAHLTRVRNQPFEGFRSTVSGDLVLVGDSTLRTARGELVLERGLYGEDIDLSLGALLGKLKPAAAIGPAPTPFDSVALDIRIVVPTGAIEVRNNVARLRASGELVARGTFGHPILLGQLEAEEGGRLTLRDLRYELLTGRILFSNQARIDPFYEIEARTNVKEYQVTLGISGTATQKLVLRLGSDPQLSDAQIVSLLATGELPDATTAGVPVGTAPISNDESIARAARELIAGLATTAVTSRTKQLFRLDRLQIDPVFVGSSFDAPRLTLGKSISKDLSVTYSYRASSNQEQVILVEYQLSSKAFLQFVRDETGVYSVDLKIRQRLR